MELRRFREEHDWLAEHALYCVLHDRLDKHWQDWPAELRESRARGAIAGDRRECR